MLSILNSVLSFFFLRQLLIIILTTVSKKRKNWREKSTPFECGFNFFNPAKIPFSIRFFLIAILFIIFDVEISLILPFVIRIFFINLKIWLLTTFLLNFMILIGTLIEWKENSFEWKK